MHACMHVGYDFVFDLMLFAKTSSPPFVSMLQGLATTRTHHLELLGDEVAACLILLHA